MAWSAVTDAAFADANESSTNPDAGAADAYAATLSVAHTYTTTLSAAHAYATTLSAAYAYTATLFAQCDLAFTSIRR